MSGATAGSFEAMDASGDAVGRATIGGKYYAAYLPAALVGDRPARAQYWHPLRVGLRHKQHGDHRGILHVNRCLRQQPRLCMDKRGTITDVGGLAANSSSVNYGISSNGTYMAGYAYPTSGNQTGGPGGWVPTVWTNSAPAGPAPT